MDGFGVTPAAGMTAMSGYDPRRTLHNLLGLGTQWRVKRCEFEALEGIVRLWVEETPYLWNGKSITAKEQVTAYDHTEELVWRHLNVFEHRCEIRCALPLSTTTVGRSPFSQKQLEK